MVTKLAVRLMYSNAKAVPRNAAKFWDLLQSTGGQAAVLLFAVINNALIVRGPTNGNLHAELEAEFVDPDLREALVTNRLRSEADIVLFNRKVGSGKATFQFRRPR